MMETEMEFLGYLVFIEPISQQNAPLIFQGYVMRPDRVWFIRPVTTKDTEHMIPRLRLFQTLAEFLLDYPWRWEQCGPPATSVPA